MATLPPTLPSALASLLADWREQEGRRGGEPTGHAVGHAQSPGLSLFSHPSVSLAADAPVDANIILIGDYSSGQQYVAEALGVADKPSSNHSADLKACSLGSPLSLGFTYACGSWTPDGVCAALRKQQQALGVWRDDGESSGEGSSASRATHVWSVEGRDVPIAPLCDTIFTGMETSARASLARLQRLAAAPEGTSGSFGGIAHSNSGGGGGGGMVKIGKGEVVGDGTPELPASPLALAAEHAAFVAVIDASLPTSIHTQLEWVLERVGAISQALSSRLSSEDAARLRKLVQLRATGTAASRSNRAAGGEGSTAPLPRLATLAVPAAGVGVSPTGDPSPLLLLSLTIVVTYSEHLLSVSHARALGLKPPFTSSSSLLQGEVAQLLRGLPVESGRGGGEQATLRSIEAAVTARQTESSGGSGGLGEGAREYLTDFGAALAAAVTASTRELSEKQSAFCVAQLRTHALRYDATVQACDTLPTSKSASNATRALRDVLASNTGGWAELLARMCQPALASPSMPAATTTTATSESGTGANGSSEGEGLKLPSLPREEVSALHCLHIPAGYDSHVLIGDSLRADRGGAFTLAELAEWSSLPHDDGGRLTSLPSTASAEEICALLPRLLISAATNARVFEGAARNTRGDEEASPVSPTHTQPLAGDLRLYGSSLAAYMANVHVGCLPGNDPTAVAAWRLGASTPPWPEFLVELKRKHDDLVSRVTKVKRKMFFETMGARGGEAGPDTKR